MSSSSCEIARIRRYLPWGIPIILLTLFADYYLASEVLARSLNDFRFMAPIIGISPGSILAPSFAPLAILMLIILPMKAVPVSESVTAKLTRVLNFVLWGNALVLVLFVPMLSVSQHYFMPHLGYSKCSELRGNPTIWSTDWVKNPDWCVRGKTRKWVAEQARLAESTRKTP